MVTAPALLEETIGAAFDRMRRLLEETIGAAADQAAGEYPISRFLVTCTSPTSSR